MQEALNHFIHLLQDKTICRADVFEIEQKLNKKFITSEFPLNSFTERRSDVLASRVLEIALRERNRMQRFAGRGDEDKYKKLRDIISFDNISDQDDAANTEMMTIADVDSLVYKLFDQSADNDNIQHGLNDLRADYKQLIRSILKDKPFDYQPDIMREKLGTLSYIATNLLTGHRSANRMFEVDFGPLGGSGLLHNMANIKGLQVYRELSYGIGERIEKLQLSYFVKAAFLLGVSQGEIHAERSFPGMIPVDKLLDEYLAMILLNFPNEAGFEMQPDMKLTDLEKNIQTTAHYRTIELIQLGISIRTQDLITYLLKSMMIHSQYLRAYEDPDIYLGDIVAAIHQADAYFNHHDLQQVKCYIPAYKADKHTRNEIGINLDKLIDGLGPFVRDFLEEDTDSRDIPEVSTLSALLDATTALIAIYYSLHIH